MCGEIRLCTFVRFVRYVITTIRACYALLRSRSALCLYGFCRMALQLLGTLERRRGALCPFAFLLTMEKLQLYSPRRLCYNSLVLGVSRCTGQEISACREASLGRSKLGRSKLGKKEWKGGSMPFAQLMAVLPLRDVACSLRVPSNPNGLKCNKDENETVIAHRSDCGLFLFPQKKGVRQ